MTLEKLFQKLVGADGKETIVAVRLPQIDAHDAVKRAPHMYSWSHDGFKKEAPVPPAPPVYAGIIGPTGGKPALQGGVGVIGVVNKAGEVVTGSAA